jgi:hypothetical protein
MPEMQTNSVMEETMPNKEHLSLANLAGGAAVEAFDHALGEVLENIRDPNTDPKAKREINLKIWIKPNEHRNLGDIGIVCTHKTAPQATIPTSIIIDRNSDGKAVANELGGGEQPDQHSLADGDGSVLDMARHRKANKG